MLRNPKRGADLVKIVNEFAKTFTTNSLIGSKEQRIEEKKKLEKEILELGEGNEEKAELKEKIKNLALDEDEKK